MKNIINFVKNHPFLCVGTCGLAILGYMGIHSIKWIIEKCRKTKKVDEVAKNTFKKEPEPKKDPTSLKGSVTGIPSSKKQPKKPTCVPPKTNIPLPLINRVKDLTIPEGKIEAGHGEYLIFHQGPDGKAVQPREATYEQAYQIVNDYAPAAIINRGEDNVEEVYQNRAEIIKEKLIEIDPTLAAVFVPKSLYEMILLRKMINEDLKVNNLCHETRRTYHGGSYSHHDSDKLAALEEAREEDRIKRKCWHLCYFDDAGDNHHPKLKEVAYRLNKAALKTLSPTPAGFTHGEILQHAEKELEFLKAHHGKGDQEMERMRKGEKVESIYTCNVHSPTLNFGYETNRGETKAMGLRHDQDAAIIRNAVALECSEIAQNAFLLYRGATFKDEAPFSKSNSNIPYSLSYGSSLFAGCVFDGGATAYKFMRNDESDAYAIPVPYAELHSSPFYIPPTNTLAQLFGDGEIFHGRTKAWKGHDVDAKLPGMNCGANSRKRDHLKSDLSKEELIQQFWDYKNQAIQLKG